MQVPKFMGLGTEWKMRWVVLMPRYQFPNPSSPASERIARSLLVCYKASDQTLPACKVWLDGAIARSVVGSKGSNVPQCALVGPYPLMLVHDCVRSSIAVYDNHENAQACSLCFLLLVVMSSLLC